MMDIAGDLGGRTGAKVNRPELKRYRQYTRHDIAAAIDAVRSGMSALQASRLYGVPSRTLYDKVRNSVRSSCTGRFRSTTDFNQFFSTF